MADNDDFFIDIEEDNGDIETVELSDDSDINIDLGFDEDKNKIVKDNTETEDNENDDVFEGDIVDDEEELFFVSDDDLENTNNTIATLDITHPDFMSDAPLTIEQAQILTNAIKSATSLLHVLIAKAHEGKAYLAMGYNSFEEYVKTEFDISRSRAYQLLNLSNTIKAIENVVPDGAEFKVTEAQARDIKAILPKVIEDIEKEIDSNEEVDTNEVVNNVINEAREEIKEQKSAPLPHDGFENLDGMDDLPESNHGKQTIGTTYNDGFDDEYKGPPYNSNEGSESGEEDYIPDLNNIDYALNSDYDDDDWAEDDGKYQVTGKPYVDSESIQKFIDFINDFSSFKTPTIFLQSLSPEQKKIVSSKSLDVSDFFNELMDELAIGELNRP